LITITARNRLSHTRSTPRCKACNTQLQFSQPATLVALRIELPNRAPRTFTVHICPACNGLSDAPLIDALKAWVQQNYDDLFAKEIETLVRDYTAGAERNLFGLGNYFKKRADALKEKLNDTRPL
jgi:hypothetical protein